MTPVPSSVVDAVNVRSVSAPRPVHDDRAVVQERADRDGEIVAVVEGEQIAGGHRQRVDRGRHVEQHVRGAAARAVDHDVVRGPAVVRVVRCGPVPGDVPQRARRAGPLGDVGVEGGGEAQQGGQRGDEGRARHRVAPCGWGSCPNASSGSRPGHDCDEFVPAKRPGPCFDRALASCTVRPWDADTPVTDITAILTDETLSDSERGDQLLPHVYAQLRAMAQRRIAGERAGHTLDATALVHEAYLKLVGAKLPWANRRHFVRAAGEAMRQVLVDHARARGRIKRGGEQNRVDLDPAAFSLDDPATILSLDESFRRLEAEAPDAAEVVRLRFYAGLTLQEAAEAMGVSSKTVSRTWNYAKAWLYRDLEHHGGTL